jgi:biopolymer transport protein ExbD
MSFSAPLRARAGPALPLASMIDVLFLLLIFFMTASVLREQERAIDVSLPRQESSDTDGGLHTQLLITVTQGGEIYVGATKYEIPRLRQILADLVKQFPDEAVVIRGDQNSRLGLTVHIMDMAYAVGLRHVYLATTKKESEL